MIIFFDCFINIDGAICIKNNLKLVAVLLLRIMFTLLSYITFKVKKYVKDTYSILSVLVYRISPGLLGVCLAIFILLLISDVVYADSAPSSPTDAIEASVPEFDKHQDPNRVNPDHYWDNKKYGNLSKDQKLALVKHIKDLVSHQESAYNLKVVKSSLFNNNKQFGYLVSAHIKDTNPDMWVQWSMKDMDSPGSKVPLGAYKGPVYYFKLIITEGPIAD